MTQSLAVERGPYGIRLNTIAPGPVPTEGARQRLNSIPKFERNYAETVPLGRAGADLELANLTTFLMTDGCDYLTAAVIPIDGGQWMSGPSTFAGLRAQRGRVDRSRRVHPRRQCPRQGPARLSLFFDFS